MAEQATATTLAVTSPSTGAPFFGEPITLTATVAASGGTPGGIAQLLVDGIVTGNASLSTAGVATFTLPTGLTGGKHSLQAIYLGAGAFDGSNSTITPINVSTAPTTSTMAINVPFTNPNSALVGSSIGFTVTVTSKGVGIPTGTVTFSTGSTVLGVAPLVAVGASFQAIINTTALPLGTDVIGARYSGDANYVGSVTSGTVMILSQTVVQTVANGTAVTSSASGSSSVTFVTTTYGGWAGDVGYHCLASTLPANAICVFSPGQLVLTPSTLSVSYPPYTSQLSIKVDNQPNSPAQSSMPWWMAALTGLALFTMRRRLVRSGAWRSTIAVLAILLCLGAAGGLSGCSSGAAFLTPKGASTVTVVVDADPLGTVNGTAGVLLPCGVNSSKQNDPTLAPCSQQTFSIALTVQ